MRKNYDGTDYVFYLPVDTPGNAKKFLNIVQPQLALFVKYDLWYFYLTQMAERNIPLVLISAISRESQVFFKWYGSLHRKMLRCFTHIFVQDKRSAQMLSRIGMEHVSVAGDTRFDRVAEAAKNVGELDIEGFCRGHKVIVAGSTWAEDEQLLKGVIDKLSEDWKLIIVPHEVHDKHVIEVKSLFGNDAVLWTEYKTVDANKKVLIVNTIGVLLKLYRYAYITYVGGGFNKSGIHNTLEAAVYSKPVLHGPVYEKFREARELLNLGGSAVVENAEQALQAIEQWRADTAAYAKACEVCRQYVADNTGATTTIMNYLEGKKLLTRA